MIPRWIRQACSPAVKRLPIFVLLLLGGYGATDPTDASSPSGAVRYVDTMGDDSNDGRSPATAWATVDRVNSTPLDPGSVVRFRAGQTWFDSTLMPPSDGVTFTRYETGADPIIFAGQDLKAATWKHESAVGPNIWSTLVDREAGAASTATYKLFRNGVWFHSAHAKSEARGGAAALAQDGDFYHAVGAGEQKLYIYNSGGDPASDPSLKLLAYGARTQALAMLGRAHVVVRNVEFRGARIGINGSDSDDITLTEVKVSGTTRHGVQLQNKGHYILNACIIDDAGVSSSPEGGAKKAGHGIIIGGTTTAQPDLVELNNCKVGDGSFIGEDSIATNAGPGLASGTVIIRGGRYINATGENPVDLKRGRFLAREGAVFDGRSAAGGGNDAITVHVYAQDTIIEDCTIISNNWDPALKVSSSPKNADGVRVQLRRNQIVSNTNNPRGRPRYAIWLRSTAGDNSIFDSNTIICPIAGGPRSSCLRSEAGKNHQIVNNTMRSRAAGGIPLRLDGTTQGAVVRNNRFEKTPAGGSCISAIADAIASNDGNQGVGCAP